MISSKEELIQQIAELQAAVSAMSADDNSLYATVLADQLECKITDVVDYLSQKDALLINHNRQEAMDVGKCLATSAKRDAFFTFFFKARDEWT